MKMNKNYDIDLILPLEVFKRNRIKTLKRDAKRKKKAQIKEWVIATIQAPIVMFIFYVIYCFMYVLIG